jgi:hypothetical protein
MDLAKVLTQLRLELDHLNAAIKSLEELQERAANRPDLDLEKAHARRRGGVSPHKRSMAPPAGRKQTENHH